MLDAYEGDALWLTFGDATNPRYIAIDAGRKRTYRSLIELITEVARPVELFVMTHVDDDHIFGAIPLFADRRVDRRTFRDVWYNCYTHLDPAVAQRPAPDVLGPGNGEVFAALLLEGGYPWNEAFEGSTVVVPDSGSLPTREIEGMRFTILSPTWPKLQALRTFWEQELDAGMEPNSPEEALALFAERSSLQPDILGDLLDVEDLLENDYESDSKPPNGSSIAFLAEFDGKAVLFTGDAHPPVLEESISRLLATRGEKKLTLAACKVSHHGSKSNTSTALLELLDCRRYLLSTSGSRHGHPDKEAIARIVYANHQSSEPTQLFFSHRSDQTEVWDDSDLREDWNYETLYPPAGRIVDLS